MKDVLWDERLIYHWTTTLWFNFFDKSAKEFCTNQRNMATESIVINFLFPRSDVQNPRGTKTEPREHIFGGLRRDEREFTMYSLIQLVEKLHWKTRAMYESNLKCSRSRKIVKGYQATYDDFFEARTK